ncbi:MAG: AAA family ATPase [Candidatus Micrarchaeota archaeon]
MTFTSDSPNLFDRLYKDQKTVFLDKNAISPHFVPSHLPFRENQLNEISQIFSVALSGKKPGNLFLYGKPGAGKTAVCKRVLSQLLEFGRNKSLSVSGTYINCRTHNSKYRVLSKIVKDLFSEESFLGYSASFMYDKMLDGISKNKFSYIVILDEIDKIKDLDELVYSLTRSNDELSAGSVAITGISNNVFFKDRLDPRSKSSLCEHEMVFSPYNAEELRQILNERVNVAFKPDCIEESAVNLAAAMAAGESGDARQAVMLLQKAGELCDAKKLAKITDVEVQAAKKKVEEEIILNMIATLPKHQQLLLLAIANLSVQKRSQQRIAGDSREQPLFSGEVYEEYAKTAKSLRESPVSSRWYRQYVSELEMFGLLITAASGQGIRGNTRLIKLSFDPKKIMDAVQKEIAANN